jgi:EAL domain-containing protein (putative c-di-GMP-specific phosphodiesterase class I)
VVIESLIAMAHGVGLRVVGEGVETRTQQDRLIGMNCDQLQGFYFSPPMPAGAVRQYIESKQVESVGGTTLVSAALLTGQQDLLFQ